MMDSFFSILPKGFFGINNTTDGMVVERNDAEYSLSALGALADEKRRKRLRGLDSLVPILYNVIRTPTIPYTTSRQRAGTVDADEEEESRPAKRLRCQSSCDASGSKHVPILSYVPKIEPKIRDTKCYFELLPDDLAAHCLSFLGSTCDRFALQCTSKKFNRLSNTDEMLIGIEVGGDGNTGKNGIISDCDSPDSASDKLTPFAVAGNLEAMYM